MPNSHSRVGVASLCAASLTFSGLVVTGLLAAQPAAAADPAGYQNVRINEVSSANSDTVELYNSGSTAVSLSGWKMSDDGFSPQSFSPSASSIPAGGFVTFDSPKGLGDSDKVVIYTADGTVVDRVDWATGRAKPAMARCGGDGTGSWVTGTGTTTFGSANAAGCPASPPAASRVRINEVSSDGSDTVELYNGGTSAVSIGSWKYVDSDTAHSAASISSSAPSATSIPAGGYVTFGSTIGLGGSDSLFLLDGSGNTVDSVSWAASGASPSDERCATGFQTSASATFGTVNSCAGSTPGGGTGGGTTGQLLGGGGALTSGCTPEAPSGTGSAPSGTRSWPGGLDVTIADNVCAFTTSTGPEGRDVSGLAFDPANPSVLWAAKNKNWLYKLVKSNGKWVPDATWSATGKQIRFAGGTGQPDSEGLTVGGNGHLYVTSERDNANNTVPKDTVMEFDPAATGSTLTPLHQWDMTAQFPQLNTGSKDDANLGFEGVGYVPDSWLTANGWTDPLTGAAYDPANYPLHGAGLFFAGLEYDGTLHVYGLNSDGSFTTFGTVSTGKPGVMDVTFDAGTQRIVATCDNTCGETHTFLKVNASGAIVPDVTYTNPAVMPVDNLEGFALAPASTCTGGFREAVWSDDGIYGFGSGSSSYGHALYSGTFPC
ncbi:lamin tail domain-containing protein [Kitasatospora sp. YST-16]|uniref:lamin tail domain-containing protein n=1 Tax=Kitasatospora sp. YST-16 TaxID=2998080 RepID=UPI002284D3A6|nr:lamin tail domain-containing protein [Kitasatospora sp. YST-16]WAL72711.1 lamin tail domain-containing protein [Kitasatospora sp. YST-16]WNW38760.1 lamin tail domain-containing protein [Streptomyces sp. Li-HN-5-13]